MRWPFAALVLNHRFSGKMVPLHFHHGDEFHLVLSDEWAAQVEGKPDHIMKSAMHSMWSASDGMGAKQLARYLSRCSA
jgi:hypothetical protein